MMDSSNNKSDVQKHANKKQKQHHRDMSKISIFIFKIAHQYRNQ